MTTLLFRLQVSTYENLKKLTLHFSKPFFYVSLRICTNFCCTKLDKIPRKWEIVSCLVQRDSPFQPNLQPDKGHQLFTQISGDSTKKEWCFLRQIVRIIHMLQIMQEYTLSKLIPAWNASLCDLENNSEVDMTEKRRLHSLLLDHICLYKPSQCAQLSTDRMNSWKNHNKPWVKPNYRAAVIMYLQLCSHNYKLFIVYI